MSESLEREGGGHGRPVRRAPPRAGSVELRDEVRARAENRPGVYRIYGKGSELRYVGKSVQVRTRLLSYFRASEEEKAHRVIRDAEGVEWDYTPDEFSALIREMKLIQSHRPRFNVQHKRKRAYAFLKITRERAPRVLAVSRVVADGSTYFGPFPRVKALRRSVRELVHTLGIRDCAAGTLMHFSDQPDFFGWEPTARCIRAELGNCLAPCAGRSSEARYREALERLALFLSGRSEEPLRNLYRSMNEASERQEYEYAAILRDRYDRLQDFAAELTAFRGQVEELSFVYRVVGYDGEARRYLIRGGRVRGCLREEKGREGRDRLHRAVCEVFEGVEHGLQALKPEEAAEILLVARWFRLKPEEVENTMEPKSWLPGKALGEAPTRP